MSKVKIRLVFLLLIIHCSLLTVLSCQNPFNMPGPEKPAGGNGYFSLSVNGINVGRTIVPLIAQNDFTVYTLEFFTAGTSVNPVVYAERTNDDLSDLVSLDGGTWDLYVTAYMDVEMQRPAAHGSLTGIVIGPGATVSRGITLTAIIEDGGGTFRWNINYPSVSTASMTITPLDGETGTAQQTLYFVGGWPQVNNSDAIILNSGYYRVVFNLRNYNGQTAAHREILHINKDMESSFSFTFEESHFTNAFIVTSGADTGEPGTLRYALNRAQNGSTIVIDQSVGTIELDNGLSIYMGLVIEGNGVTITQGASWNSLGQLLTIGSSYEVTVSRVHFKDGRSSNWGGAISNSGNLNLESCIFSGNRNNVGNSSNANGGAICNSGGNMSVMGCTFYGNSSYRAGAISNESGGTLVLGGNLFYGNNAQYGRAVYTYNGGTITSLGYNVVDMELGTGDTQSGFAAAIGDTVINTLPLSTVSFRLFPGSGAAGIITSLPVDYPEVDFYGNPITVPAAAGAVQAAVSGTGYILDVSYNNKAGGIANVTPSPDTDGLISGPVTITVTPNADYELVCWLVNGENSGSANPLNLNITAHTNVQSVFSKTFIVNNFTDGSNSASTPGTLRYALTNAGDSDIIRFTGVTPGTDVVWVTSELPNITKSITIEGNGITITTDSSWNLSYHSYLLRIAGSAEVTMNRIWFKNIEARYTGVIANDGDLNLESCIFSRNRADLYGGAIMNGFNGGSRSLNVKGCTFYGNTAGERGGAIYSGTLTLEGNLFYGNTGGSNPVEGGNIISNGYNVVDVPFGHGDTQSGWTAHETDQQISALPISPITCKVFSGGEAAGVITTLPAGYPTVDFYGNAIGNGAAAGAVQATASATGYILEISVNNSIAGEAAITAGDAPDADGLTSGMVTITATLNDGYAFAYWLVNEEKETDNPLAITLNAHTFVQALFTRQVTVTDSADTGTAGTLRYALNNAQNGDIISINRASVGNVIEITSHLPEISKSVTIEGNGVTITTAQSWNASWSGSNMLQITNSVVDISRIHFKNGRSGNNYGAAVYNNHGTLTLESCIFSDNQSMYGGGAVYNSGAAVIMGCTFYGNIGEDYSGTIYNPGGTLTLTGNLFYGNTNTNNRYPIVNFSGTRTSLGYNVVDVPLGTDYDQSGWTAHNTDNTLEVLLGDNTTSPFVNAPGGDFAPVSGISSVIPSAPPGFPTIDFYGNTRTWPGAPGAQASAP